MNYYKDKEEEFEDVKLLCRFINPVAAESVFDGKKVEVTTSTKDVLFDKMSSDLKGRYTPEELEAIMRDPKHYAGLDVIEKA